jgi:hypothetical protein
MKLMTYAVLCALALGLTSQAHAACEEPTELAELETVYVSAEQAFAELDLEQLLVHSMKARDEIVPCLGQPLTMSAAASFHRLMALEAFANENEQRAVAELHASRRLDPGYVFPESIAYEGHPLLDLYAQASQMADGEPEIVYPPEGGYVTVDSVRDAPRPSETPVIVQVFDVSGNIRETRYLQPGEALPMWGVNPFGITAESIGATRVNFKDPKPWFIAGAASMIASGVFYALAMDQKNQFMNTDSLDTPESDAALPDYMDRANGLGVASIATGGVGLVFTGLGIGFQVKFGPGGKPKAEPTTTLHQEANSYGP